MDQDKTRLDGQPKTKPADTPSANTVRTRPQPALKAELDRWLESKELQPPK